MEFGLSKAITVFCLFVFLYFYNAVMTLWIPAIIALLMGASYSLPSGLELGGLTLVVSVVTILFILICFMFFYSLRGQSTLS